MDLGDVYQNSFRGSRYLVCSSPRWISFAHDSNQSPWSSNDMTWGESHPSESQSTTSWWVTILQCWTFQDDSVLTKKLYSMYYLITNPAPQITLLACDNCWRQYLDPRLSRWLVLEDIWCCGCPDSFQCRLRSRWQFVAFLVQYSLPSHPKLLSIVLVCAMILAVRTCTVFVLVNHFCPEAPAWCMPFLGVMLPRSWKWAAPHVSRAVTHGCSPPHGDRVPNVNAT